MNKSKKYRIIDIRSESGFSKRRGGQQEEGEERKEGERILRKREKGWKKGRESGEKGDRNFSSWRKNVRALCARPLSPFVQRPAPREDLERAKIRYFRFPAFFHLPKLACACRFVSDENGETLGVHARRGNNGEVALFTVNRGTFRGELKERGGVVGINREGVCDNSF